MRTMPTTNDTTLKIMDKGEILIKAHTSLWLGKA